jgi:hypothetical protein
MLLFKHLRIITVGFFSPEHSSTPWCGGMQFFFVEQSIEFVCRHDRPISFSNASTSELHSSLRRGTVAQGNKTTMQITTQLALFLDNRPGTLARVCDALSAAKINIYAITTSDTVDHSVIRMVVSDPRKALLLFEEHGTLVVESEVLMIEGDNKPGSLARIAHKMADGDINIEYCYCATPPDAKKGLLILRTSNAKKALKILNT